jgi:hypothetical protein
VAISTGKADAELVAAPLDAAALEPALEPALPEAVLLEPAALDGAPDGAALDGADDVADDPASLEADPHAVRSRLPTRTAAAAASRRPPRGGTDAWPARTPGRERDGNTGPPGSTVRAVSGSSGSGSTGQSRQVAVSG